MSNLTTTILSSQRNYFMLILVIFSIQVNTISKICALLEVSKTTNNIEHPTVCEQEKISLSANLKSKLEIGQLPTSGDNNTTISIDQLFNTKNETISNLNREIELQDAPMSHNETLLLASSIEPLYYGGHPQLRGINQDYRPYYTSLPNFSSSPVSSKYRYNPLNSFYSLDEPPTPDDNRAQIDRPPFSQQNLAKAYIGQQIHNKSPPPLQAALLQSYESGLAKAKLEQLESPANEHRKEEEEENEEGKKIRSHELIAPLAIKQFDLSRLHGIKQELENLHRYRVQKQLDANQQKPQQLAGQQKGRPPGLQLSPAPPQLQKQVETFFNVNNKSNQQEAPKEPLVAEVIHPSAPYQSSASSNNNRKATQHIYTTSLGQLEPSKQIENNQSAFLMPNKKLYNSSRFFKQAKTQKVYKPKQMNLNLLIPPGEALVSEQIKSSGAKPSAAAGSVSVDEIVSFLQRLRPLAISEKDKPESEQIPAEIEQVEDLVDEDGHIDKEDLEDLKRQNRLTRVLPTSHLFGGSVGLVNESRISEPNAEVESDSDADSDDPSSDSANDIRQSPASDDSVFLKNLADLSSKLSQNNVNNEPKKVKRIREHDLYPDQLQALRAGGTRSGHLKENWVPHLAAQQAEESFEDGEDQEVAEKPKAQQQEQLPIELLVDKLMSSSRLATFGLQHDTAPNDPSQVQEEEVVGDEDDEEEEDEDEEEDERNRDQDAEASHLLQVSVVPEAPSSISSSETTLNGAKLFPERRDISFSSVLNRTDSWIPMDAITMTAKQVAKRTGDGRRGEEEGDSDKQRKKRRRRKRKGKRRRRKKRKQGTKVKKNNWVLVIGDHVLSPTDLIRLLGVLNKMASKKEESRERAASRKLLQFLVKETLQEYKKNKLADKKAGTTNSRDPIRDVLRSVIMSPVNARPASLDDGDTSIELSADPPTNSGAANIGDVNSYARDGDGNQSSAADRGLAKSLSEMSEDLEQYFDKDFFEDLADKEDRNKSGLVKVLHRREPKLRRASRSGYALPVPIYGTKQLEAADEDDVELDHVRVSPLIRGRGAGRQRRRRLSAGRRFQPIQANRRRSQRSRKARIKPNSEQPEDMEEDDEEEDAEPEEEGQAADKESEQGAGNKSDSGKRRSDEIESPGESEKPNQARGNHETTDEDNTAPVDPDEEPDPEPVEKVDESGLKNEENGAMEEDDNEGAQQKRKKRRRRRRKRRGNFIKPTQLAAEIDVDRRDEIPPPIEGGKYRRPSPVESRKLISLPKQDEKVNLTSSTIQPTVSGGDYELKSKKDNKKESDPARNDKESNKKREGKIKRKEKEIVIKKKKKPSTAIDETNEIEDNIRAIEENDDEKEDLVKSKDARKRRDRSEQEVANKSTKRGQEKKKKVPNLRPKTIEPAEKQQQQQHNPEEDQDYYNEGTSYSKVCDDDDKCQVLVKSSNPTLSKAIRARNKPAIEKHLGKWVEKSE